MLDGIRILDLSVPANLLLANSRLQFPLPVDEQTGEVLKDRPRWASDCGLSFVLTPSRATDRIRCELKGSLHRYHNDGRHNADDFTVYHLLSSLDKLVTTYGIDPFSSKLNNLEFGVNIELPFPVSQVLQNLISYKRRPFTRVRESDNGYAYFQAVTQRYVVKVYDKGQQYSLPANVLRFEVKVLKMEYLARQGVCFHSLADLLTVENYGALGALLVNTFNEILFDEPSIDTSTLAIKERDICQNGRNPKFWQKRDEGIRRFKNLKQDPTHLRLYNAERQQLYADEKKFRSLLQRHRQGNDWQRQTAALISYKWERLTTIDNSLLTAIHNRQEDWQSLTKSNKLTDADGGCVQGKISQINPLDVELNCEYRKTPLTQLGTDCETSVIYALAGMAQVAPDTSCPVEKLMHQERAKAASPLAAAATTKSVRPTASMLQANSALLAKVEQGRRQYKKGSQEGRSQRAAHNLRNADSNPRNNLAKRVRRSTEVQPGMPLPLFPAAVVLRLTNEQRALLDYWKGTNYEVRIQ